MLASEQNRFKSLPVIVRDDGVNKSFEAVMASLVGAIAAIERQVASLVGLSPFSRYSGAFRGYRDPSMAGGAKSAPLTPSSETKRNGIRLDTQHSRSASDTP